jgi:hypothetical protein
MKKSHKKKPDSMPPTSEVAGMTDLASDKTDPQGSYTGCPVDPLEEPVQDVDDL